MSLALGRRDLLGALLALGCAPLVTAHRGGVEGLIPESVAEIARRVGARCRAAGVASDEAALLAGYAGAGAAELATFLAAKVRADFAADRLVALGPWWLAETEARVLAML